MWKRHLLCQSMGKPAGDNANPPRGLGFQYSLRAPSQECCWNRQTGWVQRSIRWKVLNPVKGLDTGDPKSGSWELNSAWAHGLLLSKYWGLWCLS
jgi:hypothetical protein